MTHTTASSRDGSTADVRHVCSDIGEPGTPVQLELEGLGTVHPLIAAGHIDPRFILSDETCRIGRKYLAEMRRLLSASQARPAA